MHANLEDTRLPSASFDLVSSSFTIHELPPQAICALIAEARRLLRPGGVLLLADNNPRSAVPALLSHLYRVICYLSERSQPCTPGTRLPTCD